MKLLANNKPQRFNIVLVGATNVGKSSLFNRFTRSKDALVSSEEHLTRDIRTGDLPLPTPDQVIEERIYRQRKIDKEVVYPSALLSDSAGLEFESKDNFDQSIRDHSIEAIAKADCLLYVFDSQFGLSAADFKVFELIRRLKIPKLVVANKIDTVDPLEAMSEASKLGFEAYQFFPVSALQRRGLNALRYELRNLHDRWEVSRLQSVENQTIEASASEGSVDDETTIAPLEETAENAGDSGEQVEEVKQIDAQPESLDQPSEDSFDDVSEQEVSTLVLCGRPNAGKSTLFNSLVESKRSLVSDRERSTRDEIHADIEIGNQPWKLIDTAGVFASWRMDKDVNRMAASRTIRSISQAHITAVVVDITRGLTRLDKTLLARGQDAGQSVIVLGNKIDLIEEHLQRKALLALKYEVSAIAPGDMVIALSAIKGTHLKALKQVLVKLRRQHDHVLTTNQINRALKLATEKLPPPHGRGKRPIKLKYATLIDRSPFVIKIFGNQTEFIPSNYESFLKSELQQTLGLDNTPIQLEYETSHNPYGHLTNELSDRQQRRRTRLIRDRKGR